MSSIACVLIGSFNPQIFNNFWLAQHNLIRQEECDNAKIDIIHPNLSQFSISDLQFRITHEHLQIFTQNQSKIEQIRDLLISIFSLLEHTPINKMGINYECHHPLEDKEKWNALGDKLAPKQCWNEILEKPGLLSLSLKGLNSEDKNNSTIIKIEPSGLYEHSVFIHINNHYDFPESKNAIAALDCIRNKWDSNIKESVIKAEKITNF